MLLNVKHKQKDIKQKINFKQIDKSRNCFKEYFDFLKIIL